MSKDILHERATNMRLVPTKAEKQFRDRLELKGIKYKTQVVIGKYIVDFLVGKIIYEIDGSSHDGKEVYDSIRDSDLKMKGYNVIHIKNKDVLNYQFKKHKPEPQQWTKPVITDDMAPLEKQRIERMQRSHSVWKEIQGVVENKKRKPNGLYKIKKGKPKRRF